MQSLAVSGVAQFLHIEAMETSDGQWSREQIIMGFQVVYGVSAPYFPPLPSLLSPDWTSPLPSPLPPPWLCVDNITSSQDYLICIEMFFASLAFSVYFSYRDYLPKVNTHRCPSPPPPAL